MLKIWSKGAKLQVNPKGQDFTFYSRKNDKSKDVNAKNPKQQQK